MRRIILVVAAALALISGACSSSAASNDPYEIVHKATETSWQQVQVDLGVTVKSGGTTGYGQKHPARHPQLFEQVHLCRKNPALEFQ